MTPTTNADACMRNSFVSGTVFREQTARQISCISLNYNLLTRLRSWPDLTAVSAVTRPSDNNTTELAEDTERVKMSRGTALNFKLTAAGSSQCQSNERQR